MGTQYPASPHQAMPVRFSDMGDFPREWRHTQDLLEGGQAHTFVVRRADGSDPNEYVLKRLKNPKREDYFEREIQACVTLDHPNILRVLEHGRTPGGKPFLITEYCRAGSLERKDKFSDPGSGVRFFQQIVAGLAYCHAHKPAVHHLDLKPANILLKGTQPVVGDFGICFIEDDEVTMTKEGPRGSMYYCAPELRNLRISGSPNLAAADVYSLGKILYWLFTAEVYDGHEEDYAEDATRHLATLFPSHPQFAFIDELVSSTVRRNPSERLASAVDLAGRVQQLAERIEAGGRVLDLRVPQRCLYCGRGTYRPAHEQIHSNIGSQLPKFPDIETRKAPPQYQQQVYGSPPIYDYLRGVANSMLGFGGGSGVGVPLFLVCDYCGNVQYFRLDLTADGRGENWRP